VSLHSKKDYKAIAPCLYSHVTFGSSTFFRVETYGKFHSPRTLLFSRKDPVKRVITYNNYDFQNDIPEFWFEQSLKPYYKKALEWLLPQDRVDTSFKPGEQLNVFSRQPYLPIRIDPRYNRKTNTPLTTRAGFQGWQLKAGNVMGRDSLAPKYTSTGVVGAMAMKALDRLEQDGDRPWCLSVHFNAPHPPFIAPGAYMNHYWENEQWKKLFVSPSIHDAMKNSPYRFSNGRKQNNGFDNIAQVAELTSVYYGMIEEVDEWYVLMINLVPCLWQCLIFSCNLRHFV